MLEINGNPNRRDLSEHHARLAAEAGVTICVNTDAHGVDTLGNMAYGDRHRAARLADRGPGRQHAAWREFAKLRKPEPCRSSLLS